MISTRAIIRGITHAYDELRRGRLIEKSLRRLAETELRRVLDV